MFHYNIGLTPRKDDQDHIPTRGRHYTQTQVNWGGRVGGWAGYSQQGSHLQGNRLETLLSVFPGS